MPDTYRVAPTAYLLAAVLAVLFFALSSALAPSSAAAAVDVGDTPDYSATTLDGETIAASALRGRVVVVDFWATWCVPCKDAFPFYSKLVDAYDGDLVVLAVSVDTERELVRTFLAERDFALTVVWHDEHPLARTFGPSMFPTSYVIDKEGVVRHVHAGFDDDVRAQTAAQIKALVER